jgi:O-antigen ligase
MTTSVSELEPNVSPAKEQSATRRRSRGWTTYRFRHTLASRFAFLVICLAVVLSALAYGTVHYWALGLFNLGGLTILILWAVDGWQLGRLRISRNTLQVPLIGSLLLGLIQLLPLREVAADSTTAIALANNLSFDPYSTRLVIVQLGTLLVYFAAALVFIDTPHRLHLMVRTIVVFGFFLAIFGLTQSFTSPTKVYWIRELNQSTAFGPFINRHHFACYMELTIALPLGLLFAGAIEREKKLLYLLVVGLMGVALVMTTSRGGIISLVAEILFFVVVTAIWQKSSERRKGKISRIKGAAVRIGLALALMVGLFISVILLGGEFSISRFVDSVNTDDPSTGRAHFWSVTLQMIRAHPFVGAGLGAFGVIYTRFDSRNGLFRLEQAHNDYLQVLSDGGILGAGLALLFVVLLFRQGFARANSRDDFRRGVALAALGGCFAVLVHSFFDFTLHTTSNALLFLILAALATLNGRVETVSRKRRRRTSRLLTRQPAMLPASDDNVTEPRSIPVM